MQRFFNNIINGKGTLHISVDKPYYISGDLISGTLHVNVHEDIECNEVVLYVTGKEKVCWSESRTEKHNGKSRTHTRYFKNRREFFQQKLILYNDQHILPPGQYAYPFQYQLPFGLPGSFDNGGDDGVDARIEYSVKGAIGVQGFFNRDLKKKQCLVVYAQLAGHVAPSMDEKSQTIRFLCCVPQGTCKLRVAMDKNMYGPGEVPQIQCDIQNTSKKNIRSMKCHLRRTTTVIGSGRKRTMVRTICTAAFPGVPAGMSVSQPQPFQLQGKGMYPSTCSSFITVSYSIDIVCDIAWCPDLNVNLPIALGAPNVQSMQFHQPEAIIAGVPIAQETKNYSEV